MYGENVHKLTTTTIPLARCFKYKFMRNSKRGQSPKYEIWYFVTPVVQFITTTTTAIKKTAFNLTDSDFTQCVCERECACCCNGQQRIQPDYLFPATNQLSEEEKLRERERERNKHKVYVTFKQQYIYRANVQAQ